MPEPSELVLELSRRPVSGVEPVPFLGQAAVAIARALGVRGAVLVVPGPGWVAGSDDTATLVGEIQHRDGQGPVPTAVRTARPMLTPDLTRIGPPALAALADETGLAGSVAAALTVDGRVVGVLQLLGGPERPVGHSELESLGAVPEVLAARIADLVELGRRRRPDGPPTPAPLPIPAQSPPATPPPPIPAQAAPPIPAPPIPAQPAPPRAESPDRTELLPVTAQRPVPAQGAPLEGVRVARPAPVLPVRIDAPLPVHPEPVVAAPPTFVAEPLATAAPEVVTQELRPVPPRARHRQPEG